MQNIVTAGIVYVVWCIWICRNKARFDNMGIKLQYTTSLVASRVTFVCNLSPNRLNSYDSEL